MKVQCGQCPAKYAVADDRIRDKKVRIICKRCNAAIVVDGKTDPPLVTTTPARPSARPTPPGIAAAESLQPGADADAEHRIPSPRPVAHTIMGGLEAPAAEALRHVQRSPGGPWRSPRVSADSAEESAPPSSRRAGLPTPDRGTTDPPEGANANRWRVALTKQDLRWMTTEEITQAYNDGAVKLETFVFRAGMPTWVTLLEVAEIVTALAESGADVGGARAEVDAPGAEAEAHKAAVSDAEAEFSGLLDDAGPDRPSIEPDEDPLPFALVTQRDENISARTEERVEAEDDAESAASEPPSPSPPEDDAGAAEPPGTPAIADRLTPAQMLFPLEAPPSSGATAAPAPPDPAKGSGGRWLWISISLLIVLGAAYFLGRQFGLPLR